MELEFQPFDKIPRWNRDVIVTEKLDGTNAQIYISEDGEIRAGSRNRWITPENDNYGFARWVESNKDELLKLGHGRHFGEWWGNGIQRGYGLNEKRFSLFNASRWMEEERPLCCGVVPVLFSGYMEDLDVDAIMRHLRDKGSVAAPGFMQPEGIIIYHEASRTLFKKTLDKDDLPKNLR